MIFTKFKLSKVRKLYMKYGNVQIKQHSKFRYIRCILDEAMPGRAMTLFVIAKINYIFDVFI